MTIQPTANNILIEFVPPLEKSASGVIHLPNTAQKEPKEAIVVAVGPGNPGQPINLVVGQRVLVRRYYDMDVSANGKQYRLTQVEDVVAILS